MPTVLRSGPYRFFFYASDRAEPPHIHVERDDNVAKFGLTRFGYKTMAASHELKSLALKSS
jgi:Domain of unknown function (DUF4160)